MKREESVGRLNYSVFAQELFCTYVKKEDKTTQAIDSTIRKLYNEF